MTHMETEEMVDVVNGSDEVVGKAPRKSIHKTELLHRAVHIFLIDPQGRMWLEKRSMNVDTFPGHYSSAAAGHVRSGESYLQGAEREVLEEIGIPGLRLERMHRFPATPERKNEFLEFYVARSDLKPKGHEDAEGYYLFTTAEIDGMIARGEKFNQLFLDCFKWYKANVVNKKG